MNRFIWPAFLVIVVAQWFVPASMIWENEVILKKGKVFKFLTAPVDPEDPFRGRYISLSFEENSIRVKGEGFERGDEVYLSLTTKGGYAKVVDISKNKPKMADYLSAKVQYISSFKDSSVVFIDYPFDRFYMEESKAPVAETIYMNGNRSTTPNKTYALVSILEGDAVVKNIYINDSTISDVIKNRRR